MRRLSRRSGAAPRGAGLAAMVDLLTLLLLFLLQAWSTDPPVRPGELDFRLPESTSQRPVSGPVYLDLSAEAIYLDDQRLTATGYYLSHDDMLIPELYAPLLQRGGPRLLLRAHAELPYRLIRKVLFTAREAGVRDVQLVATSRSSL